MFSPDIVMKNSMLGSHIPYPKFSNTHSYLIISECTFFNRLDGESNKPSDHDVF